MKRILLVLMVGLLFGGAANAGDYTGPANITWVGTIVGDTFSMGGNWTNVLGCSNGGNHIWKMYSLNNSMDELKIMYTAALSAYLAGKTIELYSHQCGTDGFPQARSIYIPQR